MSDSPTVTEADALTPLFLLYSSGGELDKLTRMQNLCYFTELQCSSVSFNWTETKWGHHSREIDELLNELVNRGHISREITDGPDASAGTHHHYALTASGETLAEKHIDSDEFTELVETIDAIADEYGRKPITQVLIDAEKKPELY